MYLNYLKFNILKKGVVIDEEERKVWKDKNQKSLEEKNNST